MRAAAPSLAEAHEQDKAIVRKVFVPEKQADKNRAKTEAMYAAEAWIDTKEDGEEPAVEPVVEQPNTEDVF